MRKKLVNRGDYPNIPEGTYTRQQVAEKIGRSHDTIRRWHKTGVFEPHEYLNFGSNKVWLYTEEDIQAMRRIAREQGPGRPPVHAPKEGPGWRFR